MRIFTVSLIAAGKVCIMAAGSAEAGAFGRLAALVISAGAYSDIVTKVIIIGAVILCVVGAGWAWWVENGPKPKQKDEEPEEPEESEESKEPEEGE